MKQAPQFHRYEPVLYAVVGLSGAVTCWAQGEIVHVFHHPHGWNGCAYLYYSVRDRGTGEIVSRLSPRQVRAWPPVSG